MKSKEEIAKRTPLSITSTDNPIFKIRPQLDPPLNVLIRGPKRKEGEMIEIYPGQEFRLINKGCRLGKVNSWYRYGKDEHLLIPNSEVDKVYGHVIGEIEETEYEDVI